ncbi:EcsC family protein [Mongoliitalea daihaiensis]|nr:EcsC family protein [Mongoliitalea daihaiensis]
MGKSESTYEQLALAEMMAWLMEVKQRPSIMGIVTAGAQQAFNTIIPDKVHQAITFAMEKMVKAVLVGNQYITGDPFHTANLVDRETKVKDIITLYQRTASVEGAVTGAGGILLGLADLPAFLMIKMKMLFEIARLYGYDTSNLQERIFLLYVFKLTFSSQESRNETIRLLENWQDYVGRYPGHVEAFDWRAFQLAYRDYLDLAKLLQLIPIIGAGVGAVTNYKLSAKLGHFAMQAYRMRYFDL